MRLNCNDANGAWFAESSGNGASGRFEFGPLAVTHSICPPPSMGETIVAQISFIRSYLLKNGGLRGSG
ncbi:MAG: hypothetical protein H6936_14075 [Burkholderiales bacterium]|nr:hypothetical protein [Nitrosomonas sp.]MCP5275945.1 hypothetical protein [Burkholderiales bacterium]